MKQTKLELYQVSSGLNRTAGVQRVAFELTRRFADAGAGLRTRTLYPVEDPALLAKGEFKSSALLARWLKLISNRHLRLLFQVPLFSLLATIGALRARGSLRLVHGESFAGDVFVTHSCHKAALRAKRANGEWWWFFYPVHWLLLARERRIAGARRSCLVAPSRGVVEEFVKLYGVPAERIFTIPNGVDRGDFRPANDQRSLREELALPGEAFILLFVGHEFEHKGLDLIIDGMARSAHKESLFLAVVGNDDAGSYRSQARRLGLADRIAFFGNRADVARFYAASDLFVFLSKYESFALVGQEALASGLPVVTSRVGGMNDYIEHEVNGLFVERDAEDLARTLDRVLADRDLYAGLAAAARASSESFDWDVIAQRYLALLAALQSARRS